MANPLDYGANAAPLTGRFLAHNHRSLTEKAYIAVDLHKGASVLVQPTVLQSAVLARVNPTYVHYALNQATYRFEIEHHLKPLVPPKKLPIPAVYDQAQIIAFVKAVGVTAVLEAACAVESLRT